MPPACNRASGISPCTASRPGYSGQPFWTIRNTPICSCSATNITRTNVSGTVAWTGGKDGVPVFERKERIKLPDGALAKICIRQRGKRIYLFWCSDKELRYAEYDAKKAAFLEKGALPLPEMKWNPKNITVELPDDGSLRISASCTIVSSTKAPGNWRAADYFPYDGTGVWRGRFGADGFFSFNYPKFPKGTASEPQFIAASEKEIFGSSNGIDVIRYPGQDGSSPARPTEDSIF